MAFTEAQILEALTVSMSAAFTRGLGVDQPLYPQIATSVPSSGSSNFYGWLKDLPGLVEWTGDRQLKELGSHGYAVPNKTFESSVKIKREDVEDDQIGKYSVLAEAFGREAALFHDKQLFALLKAGFSTLCYDGQNFFDNDHPMDTTPASTFSNVVGTPGTDTGEAWFLLDTTQIIKPLIVQERRPFAFEQQNASSEYAWFNNHFAAGVDGRAGYGYGFPQTAIGSKADLTDANFQKALDALAAMKKADGSPIGVRGTLLVVSQGNEAAARKILMREYGANGESNIYFKRCDLLVSRWL